MAGLQVWNKKHQKIFDSSYPYMKFLFLEMINGDVEFPIPTQYHNKGTIVHWVQVNDSNLSWDSGEGKWFSGYEVSTVYSYRSGNSIFFKCPTETYAYAKAFVGVV